MSFRTAPFTRTQHEAKPRILLADDYAPIAERLAAMLTPDFDVVATVSNGQSALDACAALDPDLAVLDVTMPGLDGFQVARALRRAGSRARIVFLTMHKSEEFVAAALAAGAEGYVHKTRMDTDLAAALDHALAGRRCVPSMAAVSVATVGEGCHTLMIYNDEAERIEQWRAIAADAFDRGDVVWVVAPNDVISRFERATFGPSSAAVREGRYQKSDAIAALADIAPPEGIEAVRIGAMIRDIEQVRLTCPGGPAPRVTILGEMAGSLCRMGRREEALAIERLWEVGARGLPFFTVCAYSVECFAPEPSAYAHVCAQHAAVTHCDSVR